MSALALACTELSDFYDIGVLDTTILMHGEVQENCGVQQDGKWDIGRLPFAPDLYTNCADVGDYLRALIIEIKEGGFTPIVPKPEKTVTVYVRVDAPPGVVVNIVQEEL
jgi:hypothetical protein